MTFDERFVVHSVDILSRDMCRHTAFVRLIYFTFFFLVYALENHDTWVQAVVEGDAAFVMASPDSDDGASFLFFSYTSSTRIRPSRISHIFASRIRSKNTQYTREGRGGRQRGVCDGLS